VGGFVAPRTQSSPIVKISFSATNPCHVWDLAREFGRSDHLGTYYSGYPASRLRGDGEGEGEPARDKVRSFSARTLAVYGARKFLPERLRPKDRALFRWQDWAFDRRVSGALETCDFIHGLPGQCRDTFERARDLGITTVLSHATGPVEALEADVAPEYERVGLTFATETQYDAAYYERERLEYQLADYHWAASSVVAERLVGGGVNPAQIWTVPYGVDRNVFSLGIQDGLPQRSRGHELKLVFAGQLSLRKGVRFLLEALRKIDDPAISVDFYGHRMAEVERDLAKGAGVSELRFHGPVSQPDLAKALQSADLLVLPSVEEGFGLVVAQALACGCPCLVSDAVGAKDLIKPGTNGGIARTRDPESWAEQIVALRDALPERSEVAKTAPFWSATADGILALSEAAKST